MRDGLGLTLVELAARLKVTPPAVRSFEQAEAEDRITLASLRRTAAAMECDLIYVLVPKTAALGKVLGRGKIPTKASGPIRYPEYPDEDSPGSFVTDLTRHTEFGE